ncbi:hypothetical protein F4801DRAFT_183982 [Xylaria longipes]|nr:hypothetical protein F4801DRAFT_183982 [Xylaria longipes]
MAGPANSRRPRLSLQTKPIHHGPGIRSRSFFDHADPRSPTAFNTLSNVYTTAIERSTPTQSTPLTAIKLHQPLKIQTDADTLRSHEQKVQTPFTALPGTPLSPTPASPAQQMGIVYPSTMTPTPPLSAGVVDPDRTMFTFNPMDMDRRTVPLSPVETRRRVSFADVNPVTKAPYSRNRALHSILRNSPLQSSNAMSPSSPRRQSTRRQKKAARRVGYESPLTRTITTEKYTRSHIDLLAEEASPYTPSPMPEDSDVDLDLAMAYSGDEIKDGGRTPGPFEEMRRQMTSLATETSVLSPRPDGIRKRKIKEKKRKWVWTIGKDDDESESGAIGALRAAAGEPSTPKATTTTTPSELVYTNRTNTAEPMAAIETSVEQTGSDSDTLVETDQDDMDIDMSETSSYRSSRATTPYNVDADPSTPTANHNPLSTESSAARAPHLAPEDLTDSEASSQRDTPIPPDLVKDS